MKLVIFGSRTIPLDRGLAEISAGLSGKGWLSNITEVLSGAANGADKIGEIWAKSMNIPVIRYKPNRDYGFPAALFIRNTDMAKECDCGLALWDGKSTGTQHMMGQMKKYGKEYVLREIDLSYMYTPEAGPLEALFD